MDDKGRKLAEAQLKEAARNNRVTCTQAKEIAQRCGMTPGEIGRLMNELGLKVSACELGCF